MVKSKSKGVIVGSFRLYQHSSSGVWLPPLLRRVNIYTDETVDKVHQETHMTVLFDNVMKKFDLATLKEMFLADGLECTESTRLYYIDNEDDFIPIGSDCELQEAVKYAQQRKHYGKDVVLLHDDSKTRLGSSAVPFIETIKSSDANAAQVTDKMASTIVDNSTVSKKMEPHDAQPIVSEDEEALTWFKDYMESYKRDIVTEVTKTILEKLSIGLTMPTDSVKSHKKLNKTSALWREPVDKSKMIKCIKRIHEHTKPVQKESTLYYSNECPVVELPAVTKNADADATFAEWFNAVSATSPYCNLNSTNIPGAWSPYFSSYCNDKLPSAVKHGNDAEKISSSHYIENSRVWPEKFRYTDKLISKPLASHMDQVITLSRETPQVEPAEAKLSFDAAKKTQIDLLISKPTEVNRTTSPNSDDMYSVDTSDEENFEIIPEEALKIHTPKTVAMDKEKLPETEIAVPTVQNDITPTVENADTAGVIKLPMTNDHIIELQNNIYIDETSMVQDPTLTEQEKIQQTLKHMSYNAEGPKFKLIQIQKNPIYQHIKVLPKNKMNDEFKMFTEEFKTAVPLEELKKPDSATANIQPQRFKMPRGYPYNSVVTAPTDLTIVRDSVAAANTDNMCCTSAFMEQVPYSTVKLKNQIKKNVDNKSKEPEWYSAMRRNLVEPDSKVNTRSMEFNPYTYPPYYRMPSQPLRDSREPDYCPIESWRDYTSSQNLIHNSLYRGYGHPLHERWNYPLSVNRSESYLPQSYLESPFINPYTPVNTCVRTNPRIRSKVLPNYPVNGSQPLTTPTAPNMKTAPGTYQNEAGINTPLMTENQSFGVPTNGGNGPQKMEGLMDFNPLFDAVNLASDAVNTVRDVIDKIKL